MQHHPVLGATLLLAMFAGSACGGDPSGSGSPGAESSRGGLAATSSPSPSAEPDTYPADGPTSAATRKLPRPLERALADHPTPPQSPDEAVAQIVAAEDAIVDPKTGSSVLEAAGRLQQVAYRELGTRPEWDARVRKALPRRLGEVVTANVRARRELRSLHADDQLTDTLPAWRIVPPPPPQVLKRYYLAAEDRFGVGWEYLAAINLVETGMCRIRGTSVAGAQGPMQFLPSTWAAYGEGDINDPRDAILAAGRYLAASGFTEPGGRDGALYAYNNSTAYVRAVTHLAQVMERRPRAFLGYYHWEIYYLTDVGDILLPEGYSARRPIPVARWLRDNPQ